MGYWSRKGLNHVNVCGPAKKETAVYVNPSPVERLILENQHVIMSALRSLLLHDQTGIARAAGVAVEDQMARSAAATKKE